MQSVFGEEKQGMAAELTKIENLGRILHISMEQGILPTGSSLMGVQCLTNHKQVVQRNSIGTCVG